MAKIGKNYLYMGAAALAVWFFLGSPDDSATAKSPAPKPKSLRSKAKGDQYLPEDYRAKFAPLQQASLKNSFVPKIKRSGLQLTILPNAISTEEGTWTYAGMATIDGKATGLLQNQAKNDSVFVELGGSWHGYRVSGLSSDSIELVDAQGEVKTLTIQTEKVREAGPSAENVEPLRPALNGPIGGGGQILSADSTNDIPVEATQVQEDRGGRRGRRRSGGN